MNDVLFRAEAQDIREKLKVSAPRTASSDDYLPGVLTTLTPSTRILPGYGILEFLTT